MTFFAFFRRAFAMVTRFREEREERKWFDELTDALGQPTAKEKTFFAERREKGLGVGTDADGNIVRALPWGAPVIVSDEHGRIDRELIKKVERDMADVDRLAERLTVTARQVGDHGAVYDVFLDGELLDGGQMRFGGPLSDHERRVYAARRLLDLRDHREKEKGMFRDKLDADRDRESLSVEEMQLAIAAAFERARARSKSDD